MAKKTKHEEEYFHIKKENLYFYLLGFCIGFLLLFIASVGYQIGNVNGHLEGHEEGHQHAIDTIINLTKEGNVNLVGTYENITIEEYIPFKIKTYFMEGDYKLWSTNVTK